MTGIKPERSATPWLALLSLVLALLAAPATADQTSLVTLKGKIDLIEGNTLLLNDFPLIITPSTQVYTAAGKADSTEVLRAGMRIEAVVRAPARTVQIINIQR